TQPEGRNQRRKPEVVPVRDVAPLLAAHGKVDDAGHENAEGRGHEEDTDPAAPAPDRGLPDEQCRPARQWGEEEQADQEPNGIPGERQVGLQVLGADRRTEEDTDNGQSSLLPHRLSTREPGGVGWGGSPRPAIWPNL